MATLLEQLSLYCREHGRVCPLPDQWHRLWEMLPNKGPRGAGWDPSLPLILAAWYDTSDEAKQERLQLHLRWASDHACLDQVDGFLRSLSEDEWHHRGD